MDKEVNKNRHPRVNNEDMQSPYNTDLTDARIKAHSIIVPDK